MKLVAALPLLPMGLPVAAPPNMSFRPAAALGGLQFLYASDVDAVLFRARAAASIFAISLALLVFAAVYDMFGASAALFALAIFVFEPNVLGHGPLVATDIAASFGFFAAAFAFYRYCTHPSILRLLVCGVAAGIGLAVKHSDVLIFPMLLVIAALELLRQSNVGESAWRRILRMGGSLAAITAIAVAILWGCYGFRYKARPDGLEIAPPTELYLTVLRHSATGNMIGLLERQHLLPEAYLYGLTDVVAGSEAGREAYLLGKDYPKGRWFYFPVAFIIKSTLGFMALLCLAVAARRLRSSELRREAVFLIVPAAIWLGVAITSKLDIGLRHILPVYPFLIVLAGAIAGMLVQQSRRWACVACALIAFHAISSLRAFPDYLPYSNEFCCGPSDTYKVLADSNVGWGGGLKAVQQYIGRNQITNCWFAYDGAGIADYYHIPCAPLPTMLAQQFRHRLQIIPEEIQGTVLTGLAEDPSS